MVYTQDGHQYPDSKLTEALETNKPQISLFASSIRPQWYSDMFKSLQGTDIKIEIVFAGTLHKEDTRHFQQKYPYFKYIRTADIKPAQCYEVARRHCKGELILWMADDCEFPNNVLGKAYRFWKEKCTRKDVVSIQSREHYHKWLLCDFRSHKLDNVNKHAPKMSPLGLMNREYCDELGGADRRYICGQWDNDLVMRLYNDGGKLYQFDGAFIELDHAKKHDPKFGISGSRPFGRGFGHDRKILEDAWLKNGVILPGVPYRRFDNGFEPYENKGLLQKSQSFTIKELWND